MTEPRAFEPIFDRHFDAVHRYLHRRAGRDLADELAVETFALAFERRACCRAGASALPWLYGIATNLLRRSWRVERRRLRAFVRAGIDSWAAYEDDAPGRDGSPLDARRARALAAMRPREDALLLYALAGLSYEEIASALEVPVGTVRTWLHRARRPHGTSSWRRWTSSSTDISSFLAPTHSSSRFPPRRRRGKSRLAPAPSDHERARAGEELRNVAVAGRDCFDDDARALLQAAGASGPAEA